MIHSTTSWQTQNEQQWKKLDFVLKGREKPVILWITCNIAKHRRNILRQFKERFPEHTHMELPFDDFKEDSIPAFLKKYIPADALEGAPCTRVLHLTGIEKHLVFGNNLEKSRFFRALNFDRELLFHTFPFIFVFWSEIYSQIKAQQLAPDFWDWLSYKFHFKSPLKIPSSPETGFITATDSPTAGIDREVIYNRIARRLHELNQLEDEDPASNSNDRLSLLKNIAADYFTSQEFDQAISATSEILKEEKLLTDEDKAYYFNQLGLLYHYTGDYNSALALFENSLKISQQIGDKKGEGNTLNNIGQIYYSRADYDTALKYLQHTLGIDKEIGDKKGEGTTLNNISQIYYSRADYDHALKYLQSSLEIFQQIGDKKGEGTILNNISQIYSVRGDYDHALQYLLHTLEIDKQVGNKKGEGTTLNNIGQIYHFKGDYDSTLQYLQHSLEIGQQIGDKKGEGTTLNNIGQTYYEKRDYDSALKYLQRSLEIRQQIGDKKGEGTTLNNIGQTHHEKRDYDTALKYLQRSLEICQQIGDKKGEGNTLNNISQIYHDEGDYESALTYLQNSLEIRKQIGDLYGIAENSHNIGVLFFDKGHLEKAVPLLMKAYGIFQQIGSPNAKTPENYLNLIVEKIGKKRFKELEEKGFNQVSDTLIKYPIPVPFSPP